MRRAISFLFVCGGLFLLPLSASAAAPAVSPTNQQVGTYPDGSPKCSWDVGAVKDTSKGAAPGALKQSATSGDKCVNELLTMDDKGKVTLTHVSSTRPKGSDACVKVNNCTVATCGTATIKLLSDKTMKISKCDPKYQKIMGDAAAGQASAADMKGFALQATAQQYLQDIQPGTVDGNAQLAKGLQNLGATPEQAQTAVANNPDQAYSLLQKIAAGDSAGAQQIATQLNLNSDVTNKISTLQPTDLPQVLDGVVTPAQKQNLESVASSVTGFAGSPDAASVQPQVLSRDVLSGGEGACYHVGNNYVSGNYCMLTQGQLGQLQGNTIPVVASLYCTSSAVETTSYGGLCDPNGYNIASKELPNGTRVLLFNPQTGQSIVATVNDRGPFVQGRDVDLTVGAANALGFNGLANLHMVVLGTSGPAGSLGQFASAADALSAYQQSNGTIAIGDGNIVAGLARVTSPFAQITGLGNGTINTYGSPFASVSPTPVGYPTAAGYPTGGVTQPTQTTSVSQTAAQGTGTQVAQTPTAAPKPVAVIIVQPAQAVHGNPVTISWSTVGMRVDLPCQVLVQSTSTTNVLGQGNEGSRTITPTNAGTLSFNLQCNTVTGVFVQQATSASIR